MRNIPIYHIVLFSVLLSLFGVSCNSSGKNEYQIEGNLANIDSGYFYAVREIKDSIIIDTVKVDHKGNFSFKSTIDTLTFVSLYFNQNTKYTYIAVDKGWKVKLEGDVLLPDIIEAQGGDINNDLTDFKTKNKDLLKKRAEILNEIDKDSKSDSLIVKEVGELKNINFELSNIAEDYVKKNPTKIASVILINTFFKDESFIPRLDESLSLLRGKAESSPLAMELRDYSEKIKSTQVGRVAPDFSLPNTAGKQIRLSDYRGKYVMLTFASTTCGACDKERIQAMKAYEEIKKQKKDKEVQFLTILLNTEVKPLSDSIRKSIKWEIMPEKGNWANPTLNKYNIRVMPYNILISPQGIILNKNLPMADLVSKLDEYLPQKAKK